MPIQLRKPQRISITVSDHVHQQLIQLSDQQGRSLSNYASFLLETSLLAGKDRFQAWRVPSALLG
jgi:hypothetical protein